MKSGFPPPGGFRGRPGFKRDAPVSKDKHRINGHIMARRVRVIGAQGEQLGVLATRDGMAAAEQLGLDLVEVAPDVDPPVCKILDYGKLKYEQQKKDAKSRKNQAETTTKELRLRYRTDVGDINRNIEQAKGFLEEGHKVKFLMLFRGREIAYMSIGREKFVAIEQALKEHGIVEEKSTERGGGNFIYYVYDPAKKK